MSLPADLIASGFILIERNGRFILRSQNSGIAVGATIEEAIQVARSIRDFCRAVDRKRAELKQQPA